MCLIYVKRMWRWPMLWSTEAPLTSARSPSCAWIWSVLTSCWITGTEQDWYWCTTLPVTKHTPYQTLTKYISSPAISRSTLLFFFTSRWCQHICRDTADWNRSGAHGIHGATGLSQLAMGHTHFRSHLKLVFTLGLAKDETSGSWVVPLVGQIISSWDLTLHNWTLPWGARTYYHRLPPKADGSDLFPKCPGEFFRWYG